MPAKLTGSYLKRLAHERLARQSELQPDIRKILDLPGSRVFLEPLDDRSLVDGLVAACLEAISSGRKVLANPGIIRADQLPPFESFCLLIYVALAVSFYEALSENIGNVGSELTSTTRDDSKSELKDWVKELTKLSNRVLEAEVNYLIGSPPTAAGRNLYGALVEWTLALLSRAGQDGTLLNFVRHRLSEVAHDRFTVWLARSGEAQQWLREYLNFQPQQEANDRVADNMNSLAIPLKDWTGKPGSLSNRRRDAWKTYRATLLELPDSKGTMFAEEFGVRRVFVQPLASYEIAGFKDRIQPKVNDVASLIGALVSTRVHGDELILLCGGPGSGKSTLCRIIASELSKNELMHPIFLRLRRLKEGADIPSFVEENLHNEGVIDRIAELREFSNVVLILDGFDELVMASRARLREFFNNLRADLEVGPLKKIRVIVSGRDTLFPSGQGLPIGSHIIRLLPFDLPRVETWGDKWRSLNAGQRGEEFRPEIFFESGHRGRHGNVSPLHHLVTWPLTLHLVARVHRSGHLEIGKADARDVEKAILYRSILAETSQRQHDQTSGKGRLGDKETRIFLRAVSWQMHSMSRDSLDFHEVDSTLQKLFPGASESERSELAEVTVVNAPELQKGEEKGFEFVHKSFAEFLVAEKIAETLDRVASQVPDWETGRPTWRMSAVDAVRAIASELGIRLLPPEVQEMLETMLGDFKLFCNGTAGDASSSSENRDALRRKLERVEELIRMSGSRDTVSEVERVTSSSSLINTPLEALANFSAALLILASVVSQRIRRMTANGDAGRRAQIKLVDLFRLIHLVELGGVAIDEVLGHRIFRSLEIKRDNPNATAIRYPPVPPALLRDVKGLWCPIFVRLQEALILSQFAQLEANIYSHTLQHFSGPRRTVRSHLVDRFIFDTAFDVGGLFSEWNLIVGDPHLADTSQSLLGALGEQIREVVDWVGQLGGPAEEILDRAFEDMRRGFRSLEQEQLISAMFHEAGLRRKGFGLPRRKVRRSAGRPTSTASDAAEVEEKPETPEKS
jgi:NACHT domain